jgi:hypothetical protein
MARDVYASDGFIEANGKVLFRVRAGYIFQLQPY